MCSYIRMWDTSNGTSKGGEVDGRGNVGDDEREGKGTPGGL